MNTVTITNNLQFNAIKNALKDRIAFVTFTCATREEEATTYVKRFGHAAMCI